MGPYTLNIGCFTAMGVTFTNNNAMVLTLQMSVLASTTAAYTFAQPTSSVSWCVVEKNEITNTANALSSAKLVANGAQPTTSFNLVSTAVSETYSFKVKTTFTNNMAINSAGTVAVTIGCTNTYTITSAAATSPQKAAHSNSNSGFVLPTYTSSASGCPTITPEITSSSTSRSGGVSGLNSPV